MLFEELVLLRLEIAGGGIDFGVEAGMKLGGAETFFLDFVDKPRGKGAMFMSEGLDFDLQESRRCYQQELFL